MGDCTWSVADHRLDRTVGRGSADTVVKAKMDAFAAWRGMGRTDLRGVAITVFQATAKGTVIHKARQSAVGGLLHWEKLDG